MGILSGGDLVAVAYSGPLWFVYSLAMIQVLASKIKARYIPVVIISGVVIMYFGNIFPFRIDSTLVGFIFFYFGYYFKSQLFSIKNLKGINLLLTGGIALTLLCLSALGTIDYSSNQVLSINAVSFGRRPFLFLVSGIAGSILIFCVSQLLVPLYNRFIRIVSNGTIIILGFHQLIMHFFIGYIKTYNLVFVVFFSLTVFFICYGLILYANKHFPILLGYRKIM